MSPRSAVSRREFVGATGALVIAFYLPGCSRRKAIGPDGSFQPNAWLTIDPEGWVTVTVDRSEVGQGVHTALAMVVADELEADWARVRLGPVPEDPSAWSRDMVTEGSTSVRTSFHILRQAGAAGREMLIQAAAAIWRVDPATCRAVAGDVVHTASGRRLGYGALAARAARLAVPGKPPLKDPRDFRLIGTRVRKLETPAKVDGTVVYGIDVKVPGMLVASIERCPVFGGSLRRFNGDRAKAMPGVRHVVALEGIPWTGLHGAWGVGRAPGVAVVADSYWQAFQGRSALEIEWDEGAQGSLDSAGIGAELARRARGAGVRVRHAGDPEAALGAAARRVEAVYEVPFLYQATMEPMNCTAHVRPDGCEVWTATQNQTRAQQVAAEVAGLPVRAVRLHTTLAGGAFGRRLESDFVAEAVALSKAVGAPVKVIWSREDDVRHGFYRPVVYNALAAGLDAGGRLTAWTHRIVGTPVGLKFGPQRDGWDGSLVDGAENMPYAIPNLRVDLVPVDFPIPRGYWRSVGLSHNPFAIECFLDEIAAAAGRDPYELRRELLRDRPRHLRTLELAALKAGWGTPLPPGRGRGIAICERGPTVCAEVAEVSVASGGRMRVHRVVCAVDCGRVVNPDGVEAQMQGGIVFGLSAALYGEITLERGRVKQSNFNDYPLLRLEEAPEVEVHVVPSPDAQGGVGEPGVGPIAPAVCNAVFAASGRRIRRLPMGAAAI
jgi:isoquinoline 1-oxidoreductase beta subunit